MSSQKVPIAGVSAKSDKIFDLLSVSYCPRRISFTGTIIAGIILHFYTGWNFEIKLLRTDADILMNISEHELACRTVHVVDRDSLKLIGLWVKFHKNFGEFVDIFLRIGTDDSIPLVKRLGVFCPFDSRKIFLQISFT